MRVPKITEISATFVTMLFVTGGTGMLGTHVLLELLSRGEKIRALKRPSSHLRTVQSVFEFYRGDRAQEAFRQIQWVEGDLLDLPSLEEGIEGCRRVFHCAAMVSFAERDFRKMMHINKRGTANVVNVCLDAPVEQLCYVSSTAAIGSSKGETVRSEAEKWVNHHRQSAYAISKYSAENEVWRGVEEGLSAVIVNPPIILGPGDWNKSSLRLFKTIKRGLKYYPSGMNAFVDARDVAAVMVTLSDQKIVNERFLVVAEHLSFKELFEQIATAFQVPPPSIAVRAWMAAIAWRIEGVLRFCFGYPQKITKTTVRNAMSVKRYSKEKLARKLAFAFRPIEESVKNAVGYFQKYNC